MRVLHNHPAQLSNRAIYRQGTTLLQRLGMLATAVFLVALVGSMAILFSSIHHHAAGPASGGKWSVVSSPHPSGNSGLSGVGNSSSLYPFWTINWRRT